MSINDNVYINALGAITLEDNVTLSAGSMVISTSLDVEVFPRKLHTSSAVAVRKNSWIGAGVIILPGIEIGESSIVAAGSVVTKNVEPYSLVAGVPAVLKRRLKG